MTTPKNTPQDERDAEASWIEHRDSKDPMGNHDLYYKDNRQYYQLGFLKGRLGYVPNQTVVAIAEAAVKEERDRMYSILESVFRELKDATPVPYLRRIEARISAWVNEAINPPEAK